jgi:hypothetical protein
MNPMTNLKLLSVAVCLTVAVATPALAGSHRHHQPRASDDSWLHNYGPPNQPGEIFAYYDGPLSARCKQGAAAYRGQDGRRHPCN